MLLQRATVGAIAQQVRSKRVLSTRKSLTKYTGNAAHPAAATRIASITMPLRSFRRGLAAFGSHRATQPAAL